MLRFRAISTVLLCALLVGNNLHLPLLQVAAWCGMIVKYSRGSSVAEALEKTFDGKHPCCMCKAIKKARAPSADEARLKGSNRDASCDLRCEPARSPALHPLSLAFQQSRHASGCGPSSANYPPPTPPPIRA